MKKSRHHFADAIFIYTFFKQTLSIIISLKCVLLFLSAPQIAAKGSKHGMWYANQNAAHAQKTRDPFLSSLANLNFRVWAEEVSQYDLLPCWMVSMQEIITCIKKCTGDVVVEEIAKQKNTQHSKFCWNIEFDYDLFMLFIWLSSNSIYVCIYVYIYTCVCASILHAACQIYIYIYKSFLWLYEPSLVISILPYPSGMTLRH